MEAGEYRSLHCAAMAAASMDDVVALCKRRGLIFPAHASNLTALPRVSISGQYQQLRYLEVLLSGTAYAVWNGFRRIRPA